MFFLFCFAALGTALGQNITVKGTVLDENSEPVIGATIRVAGDATKGALTDIDGRFTLQVKQGGTLIISYVGYKTQEVQAAANLTIRLVPDDEVLEEVVVTAMGITRTKKSIGYAAQEIKAEELTKARVTDVNNALVGKVSGVRFLGGSGSNFDAGTIILRGTTDLYSPNGIEPIYVVDGVITNKNSVNMDDVASVNVLKGPAATSLYGSQGGNGAIIITTKSAPEGESHISITHTTMWERPKVYAELQKEYGGGYLGADADLPVYHWAPGDDPAWKVLDGKRYYDYANDASWGPKFDGKEYIPFYAWDTQDPRFGKTAPWEFGLNLEELYRTGVSNTTNVAFSKAGKGYNTRISFTNVDRQGVNLNSDAVRRHLGVKSSFDVTKNFKISLDWKYTYRRDHNVRAEDYGAFGSFLQEYLQWGHTNTKISDLKEVDIRPDGTFPTWNITSRYNFKPRFHANSFSLMKYENEYYEYQWNVFNMNADYTLLEGLSVGGNVYGNLRSYLSEVKEPQNFFLDGYIPGYSQYQNRTIDITGQGYIKYNDRYFNDRLTFDAMLFGEARTSTYDTLSGATQDGLIIDKFWNIKASAGNYYASNSKTAYKTQSLFGTATLGFDDTYYLDLNFRNDWTSVLHPDKNSFLYGGASASIILSNLIRASWLPYWKLRGSFAQVGSTMSPYQIYPIMLTGTKYGQTVTLRQNNILNDPMVEPTISTSYEVGTEFRLFNHRLYGDFNLYRKDSKNQIITQTVAPASGYTSRRLNAGLIRNEGIELTLGGSPIRTKDFEWSMQFNIAKNRNMLVELIANDVPDDEYRIGYFGFVTRSYLYAQEGKPIGIIRGTDFDRDESGRLILDKDEDGYVWARENLSDDQKELGFVQPDFNGGFSTSLTYKGLTLSATLDFSVGGQLSSLSNMWMEGSGTGAKTAEINANGKNVRDPLEDGGGLWLEGVDESGNPVSGYTDARYYYESQASWMWGPSIYDATYVKLREVSLSYTFDKALLQKLHIGLTAASISFVAQNPWLIYSAMPNIDPSEAVNAFAGYIETGQAVATRSYGATISLTF